MKIHIETSHLPLPHLMAADSTKPKGVSVHTLPSSMETRSIDAPSAIVGAVVSYAAYKIGNKAVDEFVDWVWRHIKGKVVKIIRSDGSERTVESLHDLRREIRESDEPEG